MAALVLLLLLPLSSIIHAEVLQRAGTSHYFFFPKKQADFCSVYRWAGEEKELMWNSSGDSYEIRPLAVSHSGQYQEQCWSRGNVTLERNSTLLVCGTEKMREQRFRLDAGQTVELKCDGVGPNQSFQWASDRFGILELIDEETPLQHAGHLLENSSLLLSAPSRLVFISYYCLEKQQHRCDLLRGFTVVVQSETILRWVGESVELNCSDGRPNHGHKWWESDSLIPERERLNFTLMFPSLTLAHSGLYLCHFDVYGGFGHVTFDLRVCPEPEPPAVELFTGGENLTLHCGDWNGTDWVRWFMRSNRTEGRVSDVWFQGLDNMRPSDRSLVIRNVSLLDGGQYWCVVRRGDLCVFRTDFLVMFREPEVDHLLLRSVLLGAVVLTMLCVVVVVEVKVWRSGRGGQLEAPVEELEMSQLSPESDVQGEAPV